jgi:SH3 domain-binding glutamic acid-rich protein
LASDEEAKRLWRRKAPLGERTISWAFPGPIIKSNLRVLDKQQLPGILVGGTCPGVGNPITAIALNADANPFSSTHSPSPICKPTSCLSASSHSARFDPTSEEAVEYGELDTFLRLKETWDESINETRPTLPEKPIGVPGASSPSQMAKPAHKALFNASPASSPLRGATASPPAVDKELLRKHNESEFDVSEELSGYGLQGVKVTDDELLALVEELGLGGEEAGDLVKGLGHLNDKPNKGEETALQEDGGSQQQQQPMLGAERKAEAEVEVVQKETKSGGVEIAETDAAGAST